MSLPPTEKYLKYSPWEALIAIVNDKYHLMLNPNTTKLVSLEMMDTTRTKVVLSAHRSTSTRNELPVFTERQFMFDRLDLTTFFGSDPIVVSGLRPPVSSYMYVKVLSERTGIKFDRDDFIHELLETDADIANFTIEANPDSLRWVGSLTFSGDYERVDLSTVSITSTPDALDLRSTPVNRTEASHFLLNIDFTDYRTDLSNIQVDGYQPPIARIVEIIRQCTGDDRWVGSVNTEPFNICGIVVDGVPKVDVVYNGRIKAEWSPRSDSRNVLVLKVDPNLTTNMTGHLLIHYK